jgi:hypothetical protein
VTPEQAAVFYEEDEDPVAVFAWFDCCEDPDYGPAPEAVTASPGERTVKR